MDWLGRLNEAIRYIEGHLGSDIDMNHAAKIACCSSFHFQRMFSYIVGVPLSEYIRRRRMTMAAFDLQNSDEKIIYIALKYGYDSPTAFNRAFRSIHEVAPSVARKKGTVLKAYAPISFKISIRGEVEMNYRIETKEAFRIVGRKLTVPNSPDNAEAFSRIPKFWQESIQKGIIPELCNLMDGQPLGVLGVCVGDWKNDGFFDYYIAVASNKSAPEEMDEYQVQLVHGQYLNARALCQPLSRKCRNGL